MLLYLDGITNAATERNENFGRECLELFTMGRDGGYTQDDVVAASRAFTGWVVACPGGPRLAPAAATPWSAVFVARPPRRRRRRRCSARTGAARHGRRARRDPRAPGDRVGSSSPSSTASSWVSIPTTDTVTSLGRDVPTRLRDPAVGRRDRAARRVHLRRRGAGEVPLAGREARRHPAGRPARRSATRRDAARATRARALALRAMSYVPFVPPNVGGLPEGRAAARAEQPRAHVRPRAGGRQRSPASDDGRRPVRALRRVRRERHDARGRRRRARSRSPLRARRHLTGVHARMNVRRRARDLPATVPHRARRRRYRRGRRGLRPVGVARRRIVGTDVLAPRPTIAAARRGRTDRTLVVVELGGRQRRAQHRGPDRRSRVPRAAADARGHRRDRARRRDRPAPEAGRASRRATGPGTSRSSRASGYPDPDLSHFASLGVLVVGHARARRRAPGGSAATSTRTVGFDDPLAAVGIGPVPSPALLGTRSFATSIADASGLQPRLPGVGRHPRRPRRRVGRASRRRRPIRRR